jgi:hypothetical protein
MHVYAAQSGGAALKIVKLCFDQDSSPPGNPENPYKIHNVKSI